MTTVTDDDRAAYLGLLAEAADAEAVTFAYRLLDRGVSAEAILLDLVGRTQSQVGDLWARAAWNIAQEHAATHVSEQVVAAVSACAPVPAQRRGRVVVTCVDGEWHSLPAKLFAEVIRLHGWDVRFLGASVPGPHLISYLHQHGPDALAVSCSLPTRLTVAQRTISAAQEASVPVLAGGAGFGPGARWARRLGADRAAANVAEALRALESWPPAMPISAGEVHEWYVVDDEHVLIRKQRADLVDLGMARLTKQFPAVVDYSAAQTEATRSDLEQIVEFLAAGVFVDDAELFTMFIRWLRIVLGSRDIPVATIDAVLDAFLGALYDFPRALRHLAAGRSELWAT